MPSWNINTYTKFLFYLSIFNVCVLLTWLIFFQGHRTPDNSTNIEMKNAPNQPLNDEGEEQVVSDFKMEKKIHLKGVKRRLKPEVLQ